jgi:hypothetical protein
MRAMRLGRNEPCPCGASRKWKRCHGASDGEEEPPLITGVATEESAVVRSTFALMANTLRLLENATTLIRLDRDDKRAFFAKLCVAAVARRLYRSCLAGYTLMLQRQSIEVLSLLREKFDMWVQFRYYADRPTEATLAAVSIYIQQGKSADVASSLDPRIAEQLISDPDVDRLRSFMAKALSAFPDIRKADGELWSEPSTAAMLRWLVAEKLRSEAAPGQRIDETALQEAARSIAAQFLDVKSRQASKEKHAVPETLALVLTFNSDKSRLARVPLFFEGSDHLILAYVDDLLDAVVTLDRLYGLDLGADIEPLTRAWQLQRALRGYHDSPEEQKRYVFHFDVTSISEGFRNIRWR